MIDLTQKFLLKKVLFPLGEMELLKLHEFKKFYNFLNFDLCFFIFETKDNLLRINQDSKLRD